VTVVAEEIYVTLLRKFTTLMVIAVVPASMATAATQSFTFPVPQTMGAFSSPFTLPNFNTSQGTLTAVTITFSASTTASVQVINNTAVTQAFTNATSSVPLTLAGPAGLSASINATAGPFSGTAAASSSTFVPAATTPATLTISVPAIDFPAFETSAGSTGPYTFSAGVGTYAGSAAAGVFFSGSAMAGGTATISFTFTVSALVKYAANLNIGESYIDITNTGANGAALAGPGFGAQTGNLCVNVYAFDPSEELIACCSCLVTPDQTVNLGVTRDLTSKTLTGVVPTSVTVRLLPTLAGGDGTGSSCTNSAPSVTTSALTSGLAAWGTTLHAGSAAGSYATTEAPFTASTLSDGELASIGGRCSGIVGNASSFGICSSCRAGALGGAKLPQ